MAEVAPALASLSSYADGEGVAGPGAEREGFNLARPNEVVVAFRKIDATALDDALAVTIAAPSAWPRLAVHGSGAILDAAADGLEPTIQALASAPTPEQRETIGENQGNRDRDPRDGSTGTGLPYGNQDRLLQGGAVERS